MSIDHRQSIKTYVIKVLLAGGLAGEVEERMWNNSVADRLSYLEIVVERLAILVVHLQIGLGAGVLGRREDVEERCGLLLRCVQSQVGEHDNIPAW